jgi:hypothetical protein
VGGLDWVGWRRLTLDMDESEYPFSNCSASFSEILTLGQYYSLVIDMEKLVFASSNIYWNCNALTLNWFAHRPKNSSPPHLYKTFYFKIIPLPLSPQRFRNPASGERRIGNRVKILNSPAAVSPAYGLYTASATE